MRASIKEHLISDVPLGIWSSGGLDSSAVLHYASEISSTRLNTFSVSFAGREFDESSWFREVSAKYGTEHHEFDLNPDMEIADAIERMSYYSDEPSADAGALPVWFLSKMSRQFVTVALSGEGADELFGGYNTYLADRYARIGRGVPAALRRASLSLLRFWPVSDEKIGLDYKVKRMLEGSLLPPFDAHLFWNGTFSESARAAILSSDSFRENPALADSAWERNGRLNQFLRLDQAAYLPDDILYKCDRMSMAHSLEVRPPFLDHRIVEFAARLPEDLKIRGSSLKFVLRELLKDKLPASVLRRKKEGFDIPAHHWFRGALKPLLLDTVNENSVNATGIFKWPAVRTLMDDHFARRANYGYHLWGLLTLFLWINRWRIEVPSASQNRASSLSTASVTI
jgi:asparagine synthase (glutamine-hydrolysing)